MSGHWLFDLGNTRLKCAPLHGDGRVGPVHALDHRAAGLAQGLAELLPGRVETAWLASVASAELRLALLDALTARCGRISLARTSARCGGVRVAYPQPARLGVDRFLALLAVHARNAGPALVCGVGTALTVDLLDGDGRHRGGRIAPSPTLMREALAQRAAQLPAAGGGYREFADDTPDALASGCVGAALGLVERSLTHATALLGAAPQLYLHGGGAPDLLAALPVARHMPDLVLDGLARWARRDVARASAG